MKDLIVTVKSNSAIANGIYKMVITLPESVGDIRGGQFLNLSTGDNSHLLRRPLGICMVDGKDITVCYQVRGGGTEKLSAAKMGDKLKALLPLGNGFDIEKYKNVAVIGGGVGVFPLIATIRQNYKRKNFFVYAGFRNKAAVCLSDELAKGKSLTVTTDDGSYGEMGNPVSAYYDEKPAVDAVIACGPEVMLRALKKKREEVGDKTPCFVSLEERMGCGLGACLVCTCKIAGDNRRVCKDGPVFSIDEVDF